MIYIMSDLHGDYEKYISMLSKIKLNTNDTLIILGDILDRGPDPAKILQDMMQRDNVIPILGNHEHMALECYLNFKEALFSEVFDYLNQSQKPLYDRWLRNGCESTLKSLRNLTDIEKEEIFEYIKTFKPYLELSVNNKDYIIVHGGLRDFHPQKNLEDYDIFGLVWERPDWNKSYFEDKTVIVGHTPTLNITGKAEIFKSNGYINIDCGSVYGGRQACLCLDTMEEFYI